MTTEISVLLENDIHHSCKKCIDELKSFINEQTVKYESKLETQAKTFESKYKDFYNVFAQLLEASEKMGLAKFDLGQQLKSCKLQISQYKRSKHELKMKCDDLSSTIDNIEEQLKTYRNTVKSENENNEKLTDEVSQLRTENVKLSREINDNLKPQINEFKMIIDDKDEHILDLNEKINELTQEIREMKQTHELQIESYKDKITAEKKEHINVQRRNETLETNHERMQTDYNTQFSQNVALQEKIERLSRLVDNHSMNEKMIEVDHDAATKQISDMVKQIHQIKKGNSLMSKDKTKATLEYKINDTKCNSNTAPLSVKRVQFNTPRNEFF